MLLLLLLMDGRVMTNLVDMIAFGSINEFIEHWILVKGSLMLLLLLLLLMLGLFLVGVCVEELLLVVL